MKTKIRTITIVKMIAALMLFWALADNAYTYYQILRWFICGLAVYSAFNAYKEKKTEIMWIYGVVAVIFNPIAPLYFSRTIWIVVDIVSALYILLTILAEQKKDNFLSNSGFDYRNFFDVREGSNNPAFPNNENYFRPDSKKCRVYEIEEISNSKLRVHFEFKGSKGRWEGKTHFLLLALFRGSILCEDVISFDKNNISSDETESYDFKIEKDVSTGEKIITAKSDCVGEVKIKCKKMYAEKLDAYFFNDKNVWKKEEENRSGSTRH